MNTEALLKELNERVRQLKQMAEDEPDDMLRAFYMDKRQGILEAVNTIQKYMEDETQAQAVPLQDQES